MTTLKSAIDAKSEAFSENAQAMQALVGDLRAKVAEIERKSVV